MKRPSVSGKNILRKEAIGFSTIIVLTWLVEAIQLPHLVFDEPPVFYWPRVLIRTGVVLAIWLWVHFATKRLLQRLHELEKYLLICSWCRKVGHEGEWLTTEAYFGSKLATPTSHGICPECADRSFRRLIPDPAAPAS